MMDPDRVRAREWGVEIFGAGDQDFIFRQPEQAMRVTRLLVRVWTLPSIASMRSTRTPRCCSSRARPRASFWVKGFIQGMQVAGAEWSHYINDEEEVCAFLVPILMLSLNDHEEYKGVRMTPELRVKCAALLPNAILDLMRPVQVSRLKRPARHPRPAQSTKIGRNEPCPCGSGKKYKRCCGSPERRALN